MLGDHIHDFACISALENHGIYAEWARNWNIGYYRIHDIPGGSLVQFYDTSAVRAARSCPTARCGPVLSASACTTTASRMQTKYGLNIADAGQHAGAVEFRAWNNVITGTHLPAIRMNSTATLMDVTVAYNTLHHAMLSIPAPATATSATRGSAPVRSASTTTCCRWRRHGAGQRVFDYSGSSDGWTFGDNLYWDAGRGVALPADPAALSGDPKFTNAAGGDLSLLASSPAIDKALQAVPFTITDDFSGVSRPSGSANDVGAFERAQ